MRNPKQIWTCKVGECDLAKLPQGSDFPMRVAVREAYFQITGEYPEFIFSGWNGELEECERAVVEDRPPVRAPR